MDKTHNIASKTMDALPPEVIAQVLSAVTSYSFVNFFNARATCKSFYAVASYGLTYQKFSLDEFPEILWFPSEGLLPFLKKCRDCGNPEVLYRQGMSDYLTREDLESRLTFLKETAEKGHVDAVYACAIILMLSGEEEEEDRGKVMMERVRRSGFQSIQNCREKLTNVLYQVCFTPRSLFKHDFQGFQGLQRTGPCSCWDGENVWLRFDVDYDGCCHMCFCERKIELFFQML